MTSTGIAAPPETHTSSAEVSVVVGLRVVEHRGVHRRHALEDGHAVALEDLQRLAAVEARDQRQAPADGDRRVERAGLAEGVEERQRPERDAALVEPEEAHGDLDVAQQVVVRELGALRRARRARGVEDHRRVVEAALGDLRRRLAALEQRLELAGLHEHAFGVRLLGAGARGVGELVPGQEDLRPGVAEVEGDLALLEQAVHRHDGRAGAQRAVVADREVRRRWAA